VDGVTVAAVAARDRSRADAYAAKHGIPRVLDGYAELVADPDLDAVYIPLPNGRHAEWMLAAIGAGKHVLCEKPFTANAAQAREIADRGASTVVMEAFHYRYHPVVDRMREIAAGELGEVRRVTARMCIPLPRFRDIRYQYDLAGGALMDAGCYALSVTRLLAPGGAEPWVTAARATTLRKDPRVDRAMEVDLAYPGGATARVYASMWSSRLLAISATVEGTAGTLHVLNYLAPQYYHRITVRTGAGRRHERLSSEGTYTHQLRAFRDAINGDASANRTPPAESVATMRLIDTAYAAAGLPQRH
jgi:predicted dehydrogenase